MTVNFGKVTSTSIDTDTDRVLVSVALGPGRSHSDVPMKFPIRGMWVVPELGDTVELHETPEGMVARFPFSGLDYDIPSDLSEGDVAIKMNAGTEFRFTKNNDETYNIELSADGNILIDGIDFDQHVHEFEDSTINDTGDGSGSESTETKDTDVPK